MCKALPTLRHGIAISYNCAARGWVLTMRMNTMRMVRSVASVLVFSFGVSSWAQAAPNPVNPHATPEARALLAYLDSISGQATITGQHNYPNEGSRWTDLTYDLTAKYPGLFGQDFGFSAGDDKDSVLSRPAMIEEVERQYKNGAVIALTWHAVRPTEDEPVTFHDSVQGHLTDYEWQQLLTPGTPLYNRWCQQVDVIAGYLRQLRDAHVPVLFRAYHEMNGNWFWWGGRPGEDGSAALYRQIYDRFVNVHHLDNLVWVWNVNAPNPGWPPIAEYYPGPQYADVVTMDIYGEFKQEYYDSMVALAAGKPIALAEVGALPSLEVLDRQPRWTYFMSWSEFIRTANTLDQVNALYHDPRMLNRDDPRLAGPMEAIRKATAERTGGAPDADPVSPNPTAEATALLRRLHANADSAILSGQQNDPASPGAATAAVIQATGKIPAIYGATLRVGDATLQEIVHAHASGAVIRLSWLPPLPTGNAPANPPDTLTDFEWNELLTPGSPLNKLWYAQIDEAAKTLRELQKSGIAVLWNPYPESNGKNYWWAGRKGIHGSAELYRQTFDRMVNHDGVHNLLWVWQADPPEPGPGTDRLSDFFPGLLYTDALELSLNDARPSLRYGRFFTDFAPGKLVGLTLTSDLPSPEILAGHSAWDWFLAAPQPDSAARTQALRSLYNDPNVVSLAPPQGTQ
jgi:mannan endo-1,4-beta-mannosidase